MAISPGTYLRLRREASGQSIDEVVEILPTEPRMSLLERADWLRQIEADEAPIGKHVIAALRYAFPFDAIVLRQLDDLRRGVKGPEPRLCERCACSDAVACDPPCYWIAAELCSSCPRTEPGVAAQPPIDDEEPSAAPSPDNDGAEEMVA